ncbi:nicotinamide mononucleotide adenylyl transferase-like [Oryza sativa Japonica Group]|uniref:Nicotinamide mononucleotide adenylyl transferase-like n=1 Tax=Oryza sativa subsp. japonica TaxID=39947 RepID=Q5JN77_ORYSJ|nr:nicotinamide mononucleotide adenylyl transferase-like [Oryza sativa Japonica Group]
MAIGSWRKRGRMKLGDDAAFASWSEWHRPPSHASRRPPASRLARRRCPQPSSSFSSLPSELAGHTTPDPLNPKLAGHSVARFTPVGGEPEERGRRRGSRGRRPRRPCRAGRGGGGEALEPPVASGIGVSGASGQRGDDHGGGDETTAAAILAPRPDEPSPLDLASCHAVVETRRCHAVFETRPRHARGGEAKKFATVERQARRPAKTAAAVASLLPNPPTLRPATPAPSPLATAPPGPVAVEAAAPLERLSAGSARA